MAAAVILRFRNTSSEGVRVVLEPWATEVLLESGAVVDVVSSGVEGVVEVEHGDGCVEIYGWVGASLHFATGEVELQHGAVVRR
jgi:hypothetical protein